MSIKVLVALGILFGLIANSVIEAGYFQQWQGLTAPATPLTELATHTYFNGITKPCDYSAPEFSFLTNAPRNIVDCVRAENQHFETPGYTTYALGSDGRVWTWEYSPAWPLFLYMRYIVSAFLGAMLGVVVCMVVSVWRQPKKVETIASDPIRAYYATSTGKMWSALAVVAMALLFLMLAFICGAPFGR